MNDGELLALIVVMAFGAAIAISSVYCAKRHATSVARLDVLKKALEHPNVDERTKGELVRMFAEEQREARRPFLDRLGGLMRVLRVLVASLGWILFLFGGLGALLHWANIMRLSANEHQILVYVALGGFVMMTLPLAVRELTRRDAKIPANR